MEDRSLVLRRKYWAMRCCCRPDRGDSQRGESEHQSSQEACESQGEPGPERGLSVPHGPWAVTHAGIKPLAWGWLETPEEGQDLLFAELIRARRGELGFLDM